MTYFNIEKPQATEFDKYRLAMDKKVRQQNIPSLSGETIAVIGESECKGVNSLVGRVQDLKNCADKTKRALGEVNGWMKFGAVLLTAVGVAALAGTVFCWHGLITSAAWFTGDKAIFGMLGLIYGTVIISPFTLVGGIASLCNTFGHCNKARESLAKSAEACQQDFASVSEFLGKKQDLIGKIDVKIATTQKILDEVTARIEYLESIKYESAEVVHDLIGHGKNGALRTGIANTLKAMDSAELRQELMRAQEFRRLQEGKLAKFNRTKVQVEQAQAYYGEFFDGLISEGNSILAAAVKL